MSIIAFVSLSSSSSALPQSDTTFGQSGRESGVPLRPSRRSVISVNGDMRQPPGEAGGRKGGCGLKAAIYVQQHYQLKRRAGNRSRRVIWAITVPGQPMDCHWVHFSKQPLPGTRHWHSPGVFGGSGGESLVDEEGAGGGVGRAERDHWTEDLLGGGEEFNTSAFIFFYLSPKLPFNSANKPLGGGGGGGGTTGILGWRNRRTISGTVSPLGGPWVT